MARKRTEDERIEAVRTAAVIAVRRVVTKLNEATSDDDPDLCLESARVGARRAERAVAAAMLRFAPKPKARVH